MTDRDRAFAAWMEDAQREAEWAQKTWEALQDARIAAAEAQEAQLRAKIAREKGLRAEASWTRARELREAAWANYESYTEEE